MNPKNVNCTLPEPPEQFRDAREIARSIHDLLCEASASTTRAEAKLYGPSPGIECTSGPCVESLLSALREIETIARELRLTASRVEHGIYDDEPKCNQAVGSYRGL